MKKKLSEFVAASALSVALVASQASIFANSAQAAGSGCSCQTIAVGTGPVGSVSSVSGDVMIAGDNGYEAAKAGSALQSNGQIIAGLDGKLTGVVGGCSFKVSANTTLSMVQDGSKICLKTTGVEIAPVAGEFDESLALPLVAGAALVGGVVAIVVLTGKDKKSSSSSAPASP